MAFAEPGTMALENRVGIEEQAPVLAGNGVAGRCAAPTQHLGMGTRGIVVEQERRRSVASDQHPLIRQTDRCPVVEDHRHHCVVDQVERKPHHPILKAGKRSCRVADSHETEGNELC